jgi:hypothetical protein
MKFCFFIDGLDELRGDISDLLSLILQILMRPNVKICVSSRPGMIFEDEFNNYIIFKKKLKKFNCNFYDI